MGFNQKINDAMNNASRQVTTQMMKEAPADLTYVYIGAIDEKTRPFCLDAASQGALTEAQILALGGEYAESLVSGGGINCRHNWELASDDIKSQFHRGGEAQKIIDSKSPIDILSPKMAGKHKSVQDATDWAIKNVADIVDYSKTDIYVANLVNEQLKQVQKNGYRIASIKPTKKAREFFVYSAEQLTIGGTKTSIINKIDFKYGVNSAGSKEKFEATMNRLKESGLILKPTPKGIMTHEYAHFIDFINPIDNFTDASYALNQLLNDNFNLFQGHYQEIIRKQAKISGKYVQTNNTEQFAELYRLYKEGSLIDEFKEIVPAFFDQLKGS
jgi:hypothetical protein